MSADSRQSVPRLSVCMIVKNEAAVLDRCLASIRDVADELIVADTGSTDDTVAIARNYNAVVVSAPWMDDFSAARNVSIDHAHGTWILWLDADDVVPSESLPVIAQLKSALPDRVYGFIVRNERPGGTGTEFNQARMFPNRRDLRFERRIHEQIMPSALRAGLRLEQSEAVVEHHGYVEPAMVKQKAQRNVRLLLREYAEVPPDIVTAIEIADSCTLMGDDEQASRWYRYVLQLPEVKSESPVLAAHAGYGLGVIASKRERFTEAMELFREALRLTPWRTDVLYGMAVAAEGNGDRNEAADLLRRIFSVTPQVGQVGVDYRLARIKAYLRLGRLLVEMERLEEAVALLDDALMNVGMRPEMHALAGKIYLKTGRLMDALHAFEKSIQLHREGNTDSFIGLCLIYRRA
ncbi:MAG: glycosyltransferase, partial [Chitinispirillaceae bacterium]|nr:glycosyltransferase [Chitinispirillaceae bacterium]